MFSPLRCMGLHSLLRNNGCQRDFSTVFAVPKISKQIKRWNTAIQKATELVQQEKIDPYGMVEDFHKKANLNQHILKLLGTNHPVLQSIRQLMFDTRLSYQLHGLIILLMAKTLHYTRNSPHYEGSLQTGGISTQQRRLADALELYRTSFAIHTNILNLSKAKDGDIDESLQKANGIGVLLGDFFAANASVLLGGIRDNEVLKIVTKGVIDFTESGFDLEVDKNGNCLPDWRSPLNAWKEKAFLAHASLLAQGCQAVAHLAGHQQDVQMKGFNYAKNIAMAFKINRDIQLYKNLFNFKRGMPFSLELAPVIIHLDQDPKLLQYIHENGKKDVNNLDFAQVLSAVQNGDGEERCTAMLDLHIVKGLTDIQSLSFQSKSSELLINLLEALRLD